MAFSHVKNETRADWTGTVTVGNSAGSSTTMAATDLIRPSDWNSAHKELYTLSGNTTLGSTASGTNVVYAASGILSIGGTSDSVVFSKKIGGISHYENAPWGEFSTTTGSVSDNGGNATYVACPFILSSPLTFDFLRIPRSFSTHSTC